MNQEPTQPTEKRSQPPSTKDYIDLQLRELANASNRSRSVFGLTTLLSVSLLLPTLNLIASWVRNFPLEDNLPSNPVVAELHRDLLKGWVDSLSVQVPVVGVKFSSSDASTFGAFMLLLMCIWSFFSARRENHLIGHLLNETKDLDILWRKYVHAGVVGTQLFATVTEHVEPYEILGEIPAGTRRRLDFAFLLLLSLPFVTLLFTILSDFLTLFVPSAFRYPHDSVGIIALADPSVALEVGIRTLIAVVICIVLWYLLKLGWKFQNGTMVLLRTTKDWAAAPLSD